MATSETPGKGGASKLDPARRAESEVEGKAGVDGTETLVMREFTPPLRDELVLYAVIRRSSDRLSFAALSDFLSEVLADQQGKLFSTIRRTVPPGMEKGSPRTSFSGFTGVRAYQLLKEATEAFVMTHCGVLPTDDDLEHIVAGGKVEKETQATTFSDRDAVLTSRSRLQVGLEDLNSRVQSYFGSVEEGAVGYVIPYLQRIQRQLTGLPTVDEPGAASAYGVLAEKLRNPCLIELIWSYWMEQGMLVQGINAVSLRFQNKRIGANDPLARLDLAPLRAMSNLMWGYIQDEPNRLTVLRRAYEYDHHYGLKLQGKAIPVLDSADSRSRFLDAFHNLLRQCAIYYKALTSTITVPDAFPALNSIKELHLLLTEGMHNQYGDLPSTARCEMLLQQWLLGSGEMREFLGGRAMVPFAEAWMGQVDTLKNLFSWTDASVRHFRDLANFGERLLLSIRYGDWSEATDGDAAALWMTFWREEVQGYIHSYRTVTGVDLSAENVRTVDPGQFTAQPTDLLLRRVSSQPFHSGAGVSMNGKATTRQT
jgi:hypothetical protein